MSKKIIKEDIVTRLIDSIFDKIIKGQRKRLDKAMANSPELKRKTAAAKKAVEDLRKFFDEKGKKDPKWKKEVEDWEKELGF